MPFLAQKTNLHSKYVFNFVFGSFFFFFFILNLFILRVFAKRWHKCAHILKQKLRTIHWRKKCGDTKLVSEKTEALYMQNLAKQWKEPPVIILQQANFYNTYSVVVAKNHQNIRSRFLVHEFSLTDIFWILFYMAVTSHCYYEKVHRTMRNVIVFIPP